MLSVTKEIKFCAAHRLLGYDGKCANIHGHSYRALITFRGETNQLGMVKDFSEIKKEIGSWIDDRWDHALILNERDPFIILLEQAESQIPPDGLDGERIKIYAIVGNPTAENMADALLSLFPADSVTIYETETSFATAEADHAKS